MFWKDHGIVVVSCFMGGHGRKGGGNNGREQWMEVSSRGAGKQAVVRLKRYVLWKIRRTGRAAKQR